MADIDPGLTAEKPARIFDPYSREFGENPYATYKWLRDEAPVYHQEQMNFWVLSRYEDVWKAHRDAATFSSAGGVTIEGYEAAAPLIIVKDAPEHGWAKGMMTKVFSRARMAALDPYIRNRAAELLEDAAERAGGGEIDFVSNFTVKLPLDVISQLLGIPAELGPEVHHLSNLWLMRGDDLDPEAQLKSQGRLIEIYETLAAERRRNPKDDPISLLIALEEEDEEGVKHRMSDYEIAHRFNEMALAGHETVAKSIPNGAMAFMRFPQERAKLLADMSLVTKTVQEILRFDPPSQLQGRTTTRDVEYYGVTIPAGSKTMLCTGGATRDERMFPNPDVFDITRDVDPRSIFFGFGVHKCLGIHLAQQEIAIAFEELFRRFPQWEVFPEKATRSVLSNVRGVGSLPIVFGPHA